MGLWSQISFTTLWSLWQCEEAFFLRIKNNQLGKLRQIPIVFLEMVIIYLILYMSILKKILNNFKYLYNEWRESWRNQNYTRNLRNKLVKEI